MTSTSFEGHSYFYIVMANGAMHAIDMLLLLSEVLFLSLFKTFCCICCRTGVHRVLEVLLTFCGIMEQKICIVSALKEWYGKLFLILTNLSCLMLFRCSIVCEYVSHVFFAGLV